VKNVIIASANNIPPPNMNPEPINSWVAKMYIDMIKKIHPTKIAPMFIISPLSSFYFTPYMRAWNMRRAPRKFTITTLIYWYVPIPI